MTPDSASSEVQHALERHGAFLRQLSRRLVADENSADDVVQDTWLAALKKLPREERGVRAWLATVTRNLVRRRARTDIRRERREERAAPPLNPLTPEALLQREQQVREILDGVFALDEPYRSTVLLRFYENLEPTEIAERLGIPSATVRTRLARGLDQLRAWLDRRHHQNRQSWMLALLPYAGIDTGLVLAATTGGGVASTSAFTLGAFLMAKKLTLAFVLVAALTASYFVLNRDEREPRDREPQSSAAPKTMTSDAALLPTEVNPLPSGAKPLETAPFDPKTDPSQGTSLGTPGKLRTARVIGRLVDEAGQPLQGVPVNLTILRSHTTSPTDVLDEVSDGRTIPSGADGRFTFERVPFESRVRVLARPEILCDASRLSEVTKPGVHDLGDLVAVVGGSVEGVVLDAEGKGVEGVQVSALDERVGSDPGIGIIFNANTAVADARKTQTGPNGAYHIDGLTPGSWTLRATTQGHAGAKARSVKIEKSVITRNVDLRLERGATIEGRVIARDGTPVSGAKISVRTSVINLNPGSDSNPAAGAETESDIDGRFAVNGLADVVYRVRASKAGFISQSVEDVRAGVAVAIKLLPAALVHGHVVRAQTSDEIPGWTIVAQRPGEFGFNTRSLGTVHLGEDAARVLGVQRSPGLFAISNLPDGEIVLRAHAAGASDAEIGPFVVAAGDKLQQDGVFEPELHVSGRVVNAQGVGVEGATVTLLSPAATVNIGESGGERRVVRRAVRRGREERRVGEPSGEPQNAGDEPALMAQTSQSRSVPTGADGRFEIARLNPGTFEVQATHREHAPTEAVKITLERGSVPPTILLTLGTAGRIEGRTLSQDGKPLPGARVRIRSGNWQDTPSDAVSSPEARFSVTGLKPGRYFASLIEDRRGGDVMIAVAVDSGEPESGEEIVEVEAGKATQVDLRLAPKGSISGTVTEGGRPVPGTKLTLLRKDQAFPIGAPSTRTDSEGVFHFDDVRLGEYTVSADPPGGAVPIRRPLRISGPTEHRLPFELPTGSIEGRVTQFATEKPLKGVRLGVIRESKDEGSGQTTHATAVFVTATSDGSGEDPMVQSIVVGESGPEPAVTDADGRYVIRYLEPGTYSVGISGAGVLNESKKNVEVRENSVLRAQDFSARLGATLLVSAESLEDSNPVLMVRVYSPGATEPDTQEVGNGKKPIRIEGLKAGPYRVEIESPMTEAVGEAQIVAVEGQETPVSIKLKKKN